MKRFCFTLLLLGFSLNSFSQAFDGGIFAGLAASQLEGDNWGGYNKAGLTFGVYSSAILNQYIDAQIEIKYIQKGSSSKNKSSDPFYLSKLNYIEVPVFLKYRFLNKFSAHIGVAGGYLQKSTENKDGIGDEPANPDFNPFELSGLIGFEYEIINKLFANVRLNYSILPVRAHPNDQTYYLNQGQYNNVLSFAVYYQISNSDERKRKKDCDCPKRSKRFRLR